MIHHARMTARLDGEFAVFLIGMRINKPFMIHKWLPASRAMSRMLKELYAQPAQGLMSHEMWFSRTIILVQYWKNLDALLTYATAKDAQHLPAWRAFHQSIGTDGSVGIWHETYSVQPGRYENIYVNMPAFGLGKAGNLVEAKSGLQSASGRLNHNSAH